MKQYEVKAEQYGHRRVLAVRGLVTSKELEAIKRVVKINKLSTSRWTTITVEDK